MELCTRIEFTTTLPDDSIEDEHDIIKPSGQNVAGAIAAMLAGQGMPTSDPELDFEHGWEFTAESDDRKYWLLVTDLDDFHLVQVKDVSPFLARLFKGKDKIAAFMDNLYRSVAADPRFGSVKWFEG